MTRKTDYLFQRPGSQNWYVKLQSPSKRIEKSLGTPDRREAEILAFPMIRDHKAALLAARPRFEASWVHELEPGREHIGPDGSRIIATQRELIYLNSDGSFARTVPNGAPGYVLVANLFAKPLPSFPGDDTRPKVATKNGDDAVLETYLRHANVTGSKEREARDTWALYRQLTDSKPLKEATRDDGRKLVEYFESHGLKTATMTKKIMWLKAAVNLAIDEGKLRFNPFKGIVPNRDDSQTRLPLDEDDIENAKRNLGRLSANYQLLFRLLACTGMRLSEAFEIDKEMKEGGFRYVIVGSKTDQSLRRVPLPDGIPAIKGPLFPVGGENLASKALNRFLRGIGITDPRKVVHSLRHRAQDRLRAAGCPADMRHALLGHEKKTVADSYGAGFPVAELKRWLDKIGF